METEYNKTSGVVLLGFIYSANERGLIVPILIFLVILGISANTLIMFIVYLKTFLRSPKNLLICNLCAVDIYGIITTCPYFIVKFVIGDFTPMDTKLCLMQYYFYVVFSCLSVFTVTLMAVDRYYVICNPFEYEMKVTNERVFLSLAVSWMFAIVYPMFYAFSYIGHDSCHLVLSCSFMCTGSSLEESMCIPTTFQRVYRLFMLCSHLTVCLIMVGFSYAKILQASQSARLSDSSRKALSTVVTHSIVLAIFFVTSLLLIVTGSLQTSNKTWVDGANPRKKGYKARMNPGWYVKSSCGAHPHTLTSLPSNTTACCWTVAGKPHKIQLPQKRNPVKNERIKRCIK
ncbi:olfactory receptor 1073-like [Erpetoichthys calabaricus]|uniref:olfactory receptor 1073-like n=1 Tax=Erpetoichthys calabaricus TaxID=27687 RepID=UPI0022343B7B|nr:olfactory receptor 1073-like [Erpetoichthys calabaricus]